MGQSSRAVERAQIKTRGQGGSWEDFVALVEGAECELFVPDISIHWGMWGRPRIQGHG